ncbi:MAG: S26 family signal peptidase [Planctomycetota bacterium]|nr:S26 family signal peptidase [Planctomycetota bacterium]MDA1105360.1 S26 family signal peptidase [Planctomycetota bacterium]
MATTKGAVAPANAHHRGGLADTISVLLVSFSLAMVFRGFVLEGFVIPTGSMAPTLLGENLRIRSAETGYDYAVDAQPVIFNARRTASGAVRDFPQPTYDPMISQQIPVGSESNLSLASDARLGDRILVLKYLWPFHGPERYDSVVFKNPTNPVGDAAYYVKRCVGLPNERFCIADGDIFTGPADGAVDQMTIARKGELAQRGCWQPVYDSDYQPVSVARMEASTKRAWAGAPFQGSGWSMRGEREWSHPAGGEAATLKWSHSIIPLSDWNAYNIYRPSTTQFPMADIRVAAEVAMGMESIDTSLELRARGRVFRFTLGAYEAKVEMLDGSGASLGAAAAEGWYLGESRIHVEFWQVDQAMRIFVDGREVVAMEYEFDSPLARMEASIPDFDLREYMEDPMRQLPATPTMEWSFGGEVTLRRVQVSRDLYYRPARLDPNQQTRLLGVPVQDGLAFGVDVVNPPVLGPRDHVMFGDNSAASRDSRLWGSPHPLVVDQLEYEQPFCVPTEMVIGRAWAVYFPSLIPMDPGGRKFIPDFGRLRFIR